MIIDKAKKHFLETIGKHKDRWNLKIHIPEAEKWLDYIFKKYPEADKEILLLSVWLHDIGHYPIIEGQDHAIISEKIAKDFLEKENYDKEKAKRVLHCIRSHRNRDVKPETLEAKLMCLVDSASHFTYAPYIDAFRDGRGKEALEKLERDYKDLDLFPEIKKELTPIYQAWNNLLKSLLQLNL